jgi:hypothetical protein
VPIYKSGHLFRRHEMKTKDTSYWVPRVTTIVSITYENETTFTPAFGSFFRDYHIHSVMATDSGISDHARFWWAQNVPAEHRLCKVDKHDDSLDIYRPDIYETISRIVSGLDQELRVLSLDIHGM